MVRKVSVAGLLAGSALALSLALAPTPKAMAQQGVTWTTGFQVQNLGSSTATVTIQLINQNGTTAATIPDKTTTPPEADETIGVNGSKTYFPVPKVSSGFSGSAIVSSTQPVAAILNILGNSGSSPFYSESASGIGAESTAAEVSLPLIMRGNSGFNTWFAVQNAGNVDASVSVAYTPGSAGTALTEGPFVIKAGASRIFDQETLTGLGDKFIGSAKVTNTTTNQPLAVVVNQVGKGSTKTLLTYSGFGAGSISGGSNSVNLPLVMQANSSYFTGISIQNVGQTTASVNVTYGPNDPKAADPSYRPANVTNLSLGPGESKVYIINDATRYVGSAKVTTGAANQQVVVVVNQLSNTAGRGTAYEGLNTAAATTDVSLPLLMNANSNYFTGVQCANVGSASTTLTLTYTANTIKNGTAFTPDPVSAKVDPGTSVTWLQNAQLGTQSYIGSGKVTVDQASPSEIVCIVNQLNNVQNGDAFLTYDGVNY